MNSSSSASPDPKRAQAIATLILATACWGICFVVYKAMILKQNLLLPLTSSVFLASSSVFVRFTVGALFLVVTQRGQMLKLTALEVKQGLGLGVFAAAGMLLQLDGLAYTEASTGAFLTQAFCIWIPFYFALRHRQWPSRRVLGILALVLLGVFVLAGANVNATQWGRGEIETLLCSVAFAGQIIWVEKPEFRVNKAERATAVMFAVVALLAAPFLYKTMEDPRDFLRVYASDYVMWLTFVLTFVGTLAAYLLMNHWQPHVTATEAGLIYAAEPVLASVFALFLPDAISWAGNFHYSNERLTWHLLIGGGLITLANMALHFPKRSKSIA